MNDIVKGECFTILLGNFLVKNQVNYVKKKQENTYKIKFYGQNKKFFNFFSKIVTNRPYDALYLIEGKI